MSLVLLFLLFISQPGINYESTPTDVFSFLYQSSPHPFWRCTCKPQTSPPHQWQNDSTIFLIWISLHLPPPPPYPVCWQSLVHTPCGQAQAVNTLDLGCNNNWQGLQEFKNYFPCLCHNCSLFLFHRRHSEQVDLNNTRCLQFPSSPHIIEEQGVTRCSI